MEVALNFTLFSERYLLNEKMYNEAISLKVKLHNLINSSNSVFFTDKKYNSVKDYIAALVTTKDNKKAQIININLEDVDDRFARTVTKIFSRMFLLFGKTNEPRASIPIHIMLEEAHRYVREDTDQELIGYNIFERIAKEGRKYGILLGLISQRPSEISETTLSQCNNFIIFKMTHPTDIAYIKKVVPFMSEENTEKMKSILPGNALCFGTAFKMPLLVKFEYPDPAPQSDNVNLGSVWFK